MNSTDGSPPAFDPQRAAEEIGISTASYLKLCRTFLETSTRDLELLGEAVANADTKRIEELAHHIKGAARNMDFDGLAGAAETLVTLARAGHTGELERHYEQLQEHFAAVAVSIREKI
jgi:HPt (histidine-containing phosphotransfer) domain-containing protein